MIEETQPIFFKDYLQKTDNQWQNMNFIALVNWAWESYLKDSEAYNTIEKEILEYYIKI